MKLIDLLKTDEVTISCELFPPKQGAQLENYKKIVKEMAALKPAYMSVTYGATGGTSDRTSDLCVFHKGEGGIRDRRAEGEED